MVLLVLVLVLVKTAILIRMMSYMTMTMLSILAVMTVVETSMCGQWLSCFRGIREGSPVKLGQSRSGRDSQAQAEGSIKTGVSRQRLARL